MSEWFRAPSHVLVALPAGLDVADASLVEPASVAWHSCHQGGVGPHTRVAVVGAGAIGILAAASAQQMGAAEVAVEARHPHQHEARERIEAFVPTSGYDLVIETGGSESDLHAAFNWHMRAATWATNRDIAAARLSWERAREMADALPAEDPGRAAMRIAPRTMLCGIA